MNEIYPLTVYFDASCALCHSEMQTIKIHDVEHRLMLADCSAAGFDDSLFAADGVTREAMMACLHVRNSRGEWIKGVAAFELIYRSVGMPSLANFWGSRLTRPVMERAYPWIARHRRWLSWTGLPLLFKVWGHCEARRAFKRSRRCSEGQCSV
ncbi:MAG: DUF393 domain-containing protein [Gallionella sp.]|nr:DUF393 domain-containing protein [Gallionella sp.]